MINQLKTSSPDSIKEALATPQTSAGADQQASLSGLSFSRAKSGCTSPPPPPPPPPPSPPSPSASAPGAVVITGAGGFTFDLTFDSSVSSAPAGFINTIENVATLFANQLSGSTTVNIGVGWGEVAGQPMGS